MSALLISLAQRAVTPAPGEPVSPQERRVRAGKAWRQRRMRNQFYRPNIPVIIPAGHPQITRCPVQPQTPVQCRSYTDTLEITGWL